MYRLVTRESLEDEVRKLEETRSRVCPLAADPRQVAKDLLASLYPCCKTSLAIARWCHNIEAARVFVCHILRQGFTVEPKALADSARAPATPAPSTANPPQANPPPAGGSEGKNEKAAAKTKAKAKEKKNPVATFDVKKAKLTTLDASAFPIVDRAETKRLLEQAVLGKAGSGA